MKRYIRKYGSCGALNSPKRKVGEPLVRNGLATTPAQMAVLAQKGLPISSDVAGSMFYDGTPNPSWDVPAENRRGVDAGTLWEMSKDIKTRMRNGMKKDVEMYGE